MTYLQVLESIYKPTVGSIWSAPNSIWDNGFAYDKAPTDYHPSVVVSVDKAGQISQLAPGTSSRRTGKCVFRTNTLNQNINSFFLLKLSMPYTKNDLLQLDRGWSGVSDLNGNEVVDLVKKVKTCLS